MLVHCDKCRGRKTYMGLGMIMHPCDECKAIGWVEKSTDEFVREPVSIDETYTNDIVPTVVQEEVKKETIKRKSLRSNLSCQSKNQK